MEVIDAGYTPSQWCSWHMALRLLLTAVLGQLLIDDLLRAGPNVHRRLAHPRRKRRPHVSYPVQLI